MSDISVNYNEFVLPQKYRPKTLSECILPEAVKAKLQGFVDQGDIPNLLFCGSRGIGKTTVAYAIMNDLGLDYYKINASMDRGIDVLRNEILEYASSVSLVEGRKFVILDEADNLSVTYQQALRAFTEEFSSNCGFIMTANYPQKIIDPLKGRFIEISFASPREERKSLLTQTAFRIIKILKEEQIKVDPIIIKKLVERTYPDIRTILNKIQEYSVSGVIDAEILDRDISKFDTLHNLLKNKQFGEIRKWVADNSELGVSVISEAIYGPITESIEPRSIPMLIKIINEYDYRNYFVVNKEINIMAMLTDMMSDLSWRV